MASISSPGIGSNLDVNSIVTQLMAVEQRPATLLNRKEAQFQAKLSAVGTLKGALAALQSGVAGLTSISKFTATKKTSVSDNTAIAVSATSSAANTSYAVTVQQLATAQKLKSGVFNTSADVVGSGTLTVQFGTDTGVGFTPNGNRGAININIAAGKDSLADIRDAINAAKGGVTASIVNDGTGYRLAISSDNTGAANSLKITATDSDSNNTDTAGLSRLIYDPSAGGTKNLSQTQQAKDALFKIDGIDIIKPSNVISDAIEGVTITLLKENVSATATVTSEKANVKASVEAFVKAFNETAKTLKDLGGYNAETKEAGPLQGDAALRNIQGQLRSLLSGSLTHRSGGLGSLSEVGISFQKDGTLALNSAKLQAVLDDSSKDISTLFAAVAKATDPQVTVVSTPNTLQPGKYELEVNQLASRGTAQAPLGGSTVSAGINDSFSLTVNGVSATVTLAAGTYTDTTLAAEIQSKVNGNSAFSTAKASVEVQVSAGTLSISSTRYGSDSTVSGLASGLLSGPATSTPGSNVGGTIAGSTATGSGQELTGTAPVSGLRLSVTGGAIGGSRGYITYEAGFAAQLDKLLGDMLSSKGSIAGKTEGINASIKAIDNQREGLVKRLEQIETRYRRQFASLDTLISGFNKTSSYLQQQLASVNQSK
jgi:flagellar hook-associated protein 2